ncbi:hypothetical protein SAMN04488510_1202 [Fervidobacterium changbaicum]|nr:hypothetical protein SAMN04488510_1202 [Fervidobacterium changbaicum]
MANYLRLLNSEMPNVNFNMKSKAKRSCPLYGGQLAFGVV